MISSELKSHSPQNAKLRKWGPVHDYASKIFWKMLASRFLKKKKKKKDEKKYIHVYKYINALK